MTNFTPPAVHIGEEVLYYHDPNNHRNASAARVIAVYGRAVVLGVTHWNTFQPKIIEEVRHKDDPDVMTNEYIRQHGVWAESPSRTRLAALEARLECLEEELGTAAAKIA